MEIKDGKIIRATENELFNYWLIRFDDVMPFSEYKERCIELGTEVIQNETRNPDRIDTILDELKTYWKQVPDLRLCQIIINVASLKPGLGSDPFYLEDDEFLKLLKKYFNK